MKVLPINKKNVSKLNIARGISKPESEQLDQARGMIENYLKDKNGTVNIVNGSIFDSHPEDFITISARIPTKKTMVTVKKQGDVPFLRKVYNAVEYVINEVNKK